MPNHFLDLNNIAWQINKMLSPRNNDKVGLKAYLKEQYSFYGGLLKLTYVRDRTAKSKHQTPSIEETQGICDSRNDLRLMSTKVAALQSADTLVICTEWQNFRAPDFDLIKEKLNTNALFDGRNMFNPSRMAEKGFAYYCTGSGLSLVANLSLNKL
jgi:hypothetical protein